MKLWLRILALVVGVTTWLFLWNQYRLNHVEGRTIGQWAHVFSTAANPKENPLALQLLTTRGEGGNWLFEFPMSYDAVHRPQATNLDARLSLLMDGRCVVLEPRRATNGNCLFAWHAIYESPGTHQVQTLLVIGRKDRVGDVPELEDLGPPYTVLLTNAFQLAPNWNGYSPLRGAFLYAEMASQNAQYEITLYDSSGYLLKVFQGNLSGTTLDQNWDLMDDRGNRFSGSSFNAVFRVTVPGRAPEVQTQTVHRAYP